MYHLVSPHLWSEQRRNVAHHVVLSTAVVFTSLRFYHGYVRHNNSLGNTVALLSPGKYARRSLSSSYLANSISLTPSTNSVQSEYDYINTQKSHTHVRLYWRRVMSEMCRAPSSLNLTTPCLYENTCYTLHISYPPFEFLTETPTNSVANNSCFIRQPRYELEKLKTPRLT